MATMKQTSSALAALLMVSLLMTAPSTQSANFSVSGVQCMSNNLQQAINTPILWDGYRVRNLHSSKTRFVVCPVVNPLDFDSGDNATGNQSIAGGSVQVFAWFGPGAANDAEVSCVVRENLHATENLSTGGAGGSPTGGSAATVTITRDTDDSLPDTEPGTTGTLSGFSFGQSIVATCELDPNTGIQGLGAVLTTL